MREQFDLTDKVALVEWGAHVFAADLPEASRAAKLDGTDISGEDVQQLVVDATSGASVRRMVEEVMITARRIDILVYSVTAKPKDFYKPFPACSLEGWRTILEAELDGAFLTAQAVGRVMEGLGGGSIIFISSIYGVVGNDQRLYEGANLAQLYADTEDPPERIYAHAGYATAKGGIISLTRFLAAYWGERGIRVNCISPGGLAHPGENVAFVARYAERTPLGRKANLDEISGAIIYLAGDGASYVTGHNLVVDGGWTAW